MRWFLLFFLVGCMETRPWTTDMVIITRGKYSGCSGEVIGMEKESFGPLFLTIRLDGCTTNDIFPEIKVHEDFVKLK